MSRNDDAFRLLTPRELDCLQLLRRGLLTPQVAATLGISVATLHKHLASARRKLGVSRTAHAVLLCAGDASTEPPANGGANRADLDSSPAVRDFADALETCATIQDAWEALRLHSARLGVTNIATVVIAEPPGRLTNGARRIAMSGPEFLRTMYRDMGGENADPVNRHIAVQMKSMLVSNAQLVKEFSVEVPKPVDEYGNAILDENMWFALHQPERDALTGAPLVNVFVIDSRAVDGFQRSEDGNPRETLRAISSAFWRIAQDKRLLRPVAGLSRSHIEALTFAMRGFTVEESAEQMNVSRRSAERNLAKARNTLGASTTPAAVFRAMVYRALA